MSNAFFDARFLRLPSQVVSVVEHDGASPLELRQRRGRPSFRRIARCTVWGPGPQLRQVLPESRVYFNSSWARSSRDEVGNNRGRSASRADRRRWPALRSEGPWPRGRGRSRRRARLRRRRDTGSVSGGTCSGSTSAMRAAAPFIVAARGCAPPMCMRRPSRCPSKCRAAAAAKVSKLLQDALASDVDPGARGHLAVHRQAHPLQAAELVRRRPAGTSMALAIRTRGASSCVRKTPTGLPDCTSSVSSERRRSRVETIASKHSQLACCLSRSAVHDECRASRPRPGRGCSRASEGPVTTPGSATRCAARTTRGGDSTVTRKVQPPVFSFQFSVFQQGALVKLITDN